MEVPELVVIEVRYAEYQVVSADSVNRDEHVYDFSILLENPKLLALRLMERLPVHSPQV